MLAEHLNGAIRDVAKQMSAELHLERKESITEHIKLFSCQFPLCLLLGKCVSFSSAFGLLSVASFGSFNFDRDPTCGILPGRSLLQEVAERLQVLLRMHLLLLFQFVSQKTSLSQARGQLTTIHASTNSQDVVIKYVPEPNSPVTLMCFL